MIPRSKKNINTAQFFFITKSDKHFLSLVPLLKFVLLSIFSASFLAVNFVFSLSFFRAYFFRCRFFSASNQKILTKYSH